MKQKLFSLILTLALLSLCIVPAMAATAGSLYDPDSLLSDAQTQKVADALASVSSRQGTQVGAVLLRSLQGWNAEELAEACFEEGYFAKDCVFFLIALEEREWYMLAKGSTSAAFPEAAIDYVFSKMEASLGENDFAGALLSYSDGCDQMLTSFRNGEALPETPFDTPLWIGISLAIGAIAGLIGASILRGQLRSVRSQAAAANYVRGGSLEVQIAEERFLRRDVQRTAKQQSSSHHSGSGSARSSSGSSGKGGKF